MRSGFLAIVLIFALACGTEEPAPPSGDATATTTVSETSPPPASAESRSACELVTDADLASITGVKFTAGVTVTSEAQLNRCGFEPVSGGTGGLTVALYAENPGDPTTAFQITPDMQPVSGAGESAHWSDSQRALVARKGSNVVIVAFKSEGPRQQRLALDIARKALERL